MRPTSFSLLADAWRLWRTDWNALSAIAGLFMFATELARRLVMVPALQTVLKAHDQSDFFGLMEVQSQWMVTATPALGGTAPFPWLLLLALLTHFGTFAVFAFYLDRDRVDVRGALIRAAVCLLPYVVAVIIVSVFAGLGLLLLVIGFFYATARLGLVGPVMAAERNLNPLSAIGRSLALTRGHGLTLTALMILVSCATVVAQLPFAAIDDWMQANPRGVIVQTVAAMAGSAAAALGLLAMALVQIVTYRRLSSS